MKKRKRSTLQITLRFLKIVGPLDAAAANNFGFEGTLPAPNG